MPITVHRTEAARVRVVAYKPLGGASRRYQDTETGETISRRQYEKRIRQQLVEDVEARLQDRYRAIISDFGVEYTVTESPEEILSGSRKFEERGWQHITIDVKNPRQPDTESHAANLFVERDIPDTDRLMVRLYGTWPEMYGVEDTRWITLFGGPIHKSAFRGVGRMPGTETIMVSWQRRK